MAYDFEKRKKEIQNKLKQSGYIYKAIDYKEFLNIYELYKNEMSEVEFSEILEIHYQSYVDLKNGRKRARILKNCAKVNEQRKNEIIEKLVKEGYIKKIINYEKFLELYKPYKNEMREVDFAKILGISDQSYRNMQKGRNNVRILKIEEINEERRKEIIFEIKKLGYTNRKIDYEEFQKIYEPYRHKITEKEFAIKILGISNNGYYKMKCKSKEKVIILKTETLTDARKDEIIEELKHNANRSINYKEFLDIYSKYRNEVNELEFAEIIGISNSSYRNLKTNRSNARILKSIDKVDKYNEIKDKLIEEGNSNRKINYKTFLILYEPYKEIVDEKTFAKILGISQNNYLHIKNEGTNTIILKSKKLNNQRKEQIKEELKTLGSIQGKLNYERFLELYKPYKSEMKEREFAEILEISYNSFLNLKNSKSNVYAFSKSQKKIEDVKEDIEDEILKKKQISEEIKEIIKTNEKISYERFLEIYEPYKQQISEKDFAEILGISEANYKNLKSKGTNAIINFEYTLDKRIKYLFSKEGKYSIDYFEQVSKKYGISIEKILEIIITSNEKGINDYYKTLTLKGYIYIGKKPISREFLEKYMVKISNKVHEYSKNIGKRFHLTRYLEDIAQDTLIYIIQNKR